MSQGNTLQENKDKNQIKTLKQKLAAMELNYEKLKQKMKN